MSPAALRAVFSPDADSDLYFLLTVYNPANDSEVVARLSDGYTKRISETPTEVIYGVTSRGQDYTFIPMEISLPSEEEAQAPRCSLVIHDVTKYIIPLIRSISGPPKITMELVLSSTPDTVEARFTGFYVSSVSYNVDTVTLEMSMINYEREPFPAHSFTPAYFPGMF